MAQNDDTVYVTARDHFKPMPENRKLCENMRPNLRTLPQLLGMPPVVVPAGYKIVDKSTMPLFEYTSDLWRDSRLVELAEIRNRYEAYRRKMKRQAKKNIVHDDKAADDDEATEYDADDAEVPDDDSEDAEVSADDDGEDDGEIRPLTKDEKNEMARLMAKAHRETQSRSWTLKEFIELAEEFAKAKGGPTKKFDGTTLMSRMEHSIKVAIQSTDDIKARWSKTKSKSTPKIKKTTPTKRTKTTKK
jgi:hypothetical protein